MILLVSVLGARYGIQLLTSFFFFFSPDIIANARLAFFQHVIDHIQLDLKRRSSTSPACGATLHDPQRTKCDALVAGKLVVATMQHVGFLPTSAEEIDRTPAELRPWLTALSKVKCNNGGVWVGNRYNSRLGVQGCVSMEDYGDIVSINKTIQRVLKRQLGFPSQQHIEYLAKQRTKCGLPP